MRICLAGIGAALLSILPATRAFAQGGPPVITDDAGTPGAGRWEINVAVAFERQRGGDYAAQLPLVDLNYGLLESLQLKYETSFQLTDVEGEPSARVLGNSNFGVKWRFLDQETAWLSVSVYPQLIFNPVTTGAIGLVDREAVLFLPFEASRSFGQLRVATEVGYAVGFQGADAFVYGLAAGLAIGRVLLVADLHGEADVRLSEPEALLLLGAVAPMDSTVQLLISAGRSVSTPGENRTVNVGFLGMRLNL